MSINLPPEIWLRILEFYAPSEGQTNAADDDNDEVQKDDDLYEEASDVSIDEEYVDEEISRHADDLLFLWLTCRSVSKLFRSLVEYIFKQQYLKELQIRFPLGIPPHVYDPQYSRGTTMNMRYGEISGNDPDRAIFYSTEIEKLDEELINRQKSLLTDEMKRHFADSEGDETTAKKRVSVPPWIILWTGWYNDTDLPGLEIDYDSQSLSFRWKEALQAFLREQKMMEDMADAKQPLSDSAHREDVHDVHRIVHQYDEAVRREGFSSMRGITHNRLSDIRAIIRHHRRRKWRIAAPNRSYLMDPDAEHQRRREIKELEYLEFRYQDWNARQQIEEQLEFMLERCHKAGSATEECMFKDNEPGRDNLRKEVSQLSKEEEVEHTRPKKKKKVNKK